MAINDQTPASKRDIFLLINEIARLHAVTEQLQHQLYDAGERWKNETIEETKRHFEWTATAIHRDVVGATRARLSKDDERLSRLEGYVGLK